MNPPCPAETNPYAPPVSKTLRASERRPLNIWAARIEGKALVVPLGWEAPNLCLLTGETTNLLNRERKQLAWHNPLFALGLLGGLIPYLLLAAIFSKKGQITYRLSAGARSRQRKVAAIKWACCLVPLFAFMVLLAVGRADWALVMLAVSLLSALLSVLIGKFLPVKKITDRHIYLLGVPPEVQRLIILAEQGP